MAGESSGGQMVPESSLGACGGTIAKLRKTCDYVDDDDDDDDDDCNDDVYDDDEFSCRIKDGICPSRISLEAKKNREKTIAKLR